MHECTKIVYVLCTEVVQISNLSKIQYRSGIMVCTEMVMYRTGPDPGSLVTACGVPSIVARNLIGLVGLIGVKNATGRLYCV